MSVSQTVRQSYFSCFVDFVGLVRVFIFYPNNYQLWGNPNKKSTVSTMWNCFRTTFGLFSTSRTVLSPCPYATSYLNCYSGMYFLSNTKQYGFSVFDNWTACVLFASGSCRLPSTMMTDWLLTACLLTPSLSALERASGSFCVKS